MGSVLSHKRAEDGGGRRRLSALLLAILGVALTLAPALVSAQVAGLGVGITPAFDSPVTVGEQDQPALIQFVNNSFGPQAAVDPVTLTNIRINPSCDSSAVDPTGPSPCPPGASEPRPDPTQPVLDLDETSTAGTTCPGGPFIISGPDAEGDYTITPTTGPLVLAPVGQPGSSCVITFTFDVIQRPIDGETFQPVALLATSPTFPGGAPQTGVSRVVVLQAVPGLTTVASPNVGFPTPPASVPVGSTVFDQATVTPVANGPAPTGTVTYALYGPGDPTCAGAPIAPVGGAPQTVPVGSPSPNYVLPAQGTYNFTATYSGDVNYEPVGPVGCGVPAEQVIAAPRTVELVTQASTNSTNVAPGTTVFDIATATPTTPGPAPTGNVTYTLVGPLAPGDVTCAGPVVPPVGGAPQTVPLGQPSPNYVVTAPGTYNFIASYTDPTGTFAPTGPVGCGDPRERFTVVAPVPLVLVDKVADPTTVTEPGNNNVVFTVRVTNTGPTPLTINSLNDNVYGDLATRPGSTCGALIGTTLAPGASSAPCTFTGPVLGPPGTVHTDVVTVVGTAPDGQTATDDDDAVVNIVGVPPVITVVKDATPLSLPEPGGTYTYTVRVQNNSTVESVTITSLNDNVYGDLATRPGSTCGALIGDVLAPGAFSDTCTFTGVFNGDAGDALTDIVTATAVDDDGETATDTDDAVVTITDVLPVVRVVKTANPTTMPAPGGDFTFTAVVTNPGTEAITINSLNDDIYGNLATRPGSTCGALIGTTLAPGASSAPCSFTGNFTGAAGASQTDVITVVATDDDGNTATDNDDATVTLTGAPSILVNKTADPSSLPEPGGTFTFTVEVVNTSSETLTINSLNDDIYGNVATIPGSTCGALIGTTLAPGARSAPCTFPGTFTGTAGAQQTDVVTVVGQNSAGTIVTDDDDATVRITNLIPTVRVVKTASPLSLPEPGGEFTFTAVVTNTSNETVTITSLTDDIYGNLATRPGSTCGALIGTTLAPGASSAPCTFTGSFFGDAGASQTDIVTVIVTDSQGTTATDDDDALVNITDTPPTIDIVKTANPLTLPAPGGTFTFTVVVTNNSFEPVTITSLVDNVYGNLAGQGNCAIGATLAPNGGTYTCSFPGTFNGAPNASQTDIVTVVGVDNDGSTVTDSDDAVVSLTGAPATLTTLVSAGAVGAEVFDTATLSGGFNPTGTITFQLYGPYTPQRPDDNCTSAPIFTSVKPVPTTGDPRIIVSDRFILPSPGVYHFVATYSGDANNPPITTACQDPLETIGVGRLPLSLATVASPSVSLGGAIFDTATIAGGFNPTGNITFNFYGPDNATCTGTPAFTSVKPVNGNGSYVSDSFTPTQPGLYRIVASYSGDANNASTISACDDPLEQVRVTPLPVIEVVKTANPTTLPSPGGTVTFTAVVTNTSNVALTIRSLNDNVYGDVTKIPNSTCNTAIGTVLAPTPGPGNAYTCTFPGAVTGAAGSSHTDVITVVATDAAGNQVTDNDDAVVTITGVPPTIVTTKTATPASLPEPGGTFTFTYTVTNTGPDPVTITSLVDNIYGDLNGRGTCAVGVRLAGNGGTYTCTFTGNFNGNAGATQTDVITTTGRDDQGQTVTSQSQATVRITDVPPTVTVVKTADPLSRPEPGGTFRFTVVVTNTSAEPVTITSLVDDVYGDLNGRGSCAVGIVLPPGASYSCAFDGDFTGVSGQSQIDIVTVTVVDDDNTTARDDDDAVVTLTPPGSPPVTSPPTTVPPPPQRPPLVRTGSELAGAARVAGLMLLFGMALVAATRRYGDEGPGLATVPAGPGSGPGPRGGGGGGGFGGLRFDGGNPFGRTPRQQPPRLPRGGGGTALVEPPAPPAPEPEAHAPPAPELAWDDWVGARPTAPPVEATVVEPAFVEPVQPIIIQPGGDEPGSVEPVVPGPHVEPQPVEPAPDPEPASEPVAATPEVLVPTVVPHVRSTNGLDAAALDAADALARPTGPAGPPSGRRRRR